MLSDNLPFRDHGAGAVTSRRSSEQGRVALGTVLFILLVAVTGAALVIATGNIDRFTWWAWVLFIVSCASALAGIGQAIAQRWRLVGLAFVVVGATMPTGLGAAINAVIVLLALPLVLFGSRVAGSPSQLEQPSPGGAG
jgi:hypothetical protein